MKSIHVEPDVLAAWSEGTLPSSDARQVEAHLADCATCQEMLAVFVRAEPPPAVSSGVGSVRSGFSSVVSGFSRTNWRWAVPLAAAATVAAIWVAIPEDERTAQLNPTAVPTLSEPAAPPVESVSVDSAAATQEEKQSAARPDAPGSSLADRAAPETRAEKAEQEKADQSATSRRLEPNERDQDLKAEAAAPGPPAAAAQAARAPADPQPAQEQNRSRAEGAAASLMRQATPVEVVSPDLQIRWRIVPTGRLERSTNAGKTWEAVTLPQPVNVTDVRAPSATTAIVTAADGRQFRTEDQGKTWNLVQP